jgi:pimeloyl-ACP methyl ester carboxylesterase
MMLTTWMRSGEDLPEPVEEKWVEVGGHKVRYFKTGSGPDLLLVHGLLGSAECWNEVLPRLASESTVYAIDAIGSGVSDCAPEIDTSLEGTADRLLSFLDAIGLKKVDLAGTSYGGAVAMVVAARHPDRIRNLILHAPTNPYSHSADSLIRFYRTRFGGWFAHRLLRMPRRMQDLALARVCGADPEVANLLLDKYVSLLRRPGIIEHQLAVIRHLFADMKLLIGYLKQLKHHPVLLIWGTQDRAVSMSSALVLQSALENSLLTLIPGAGHLPFEECPEEFAQAINRYLRKQDREGANGPFLVPARPRRSRSAA